jgi:hypothetical protein
MRTCPRTPAAKALARDALLAGQQGARMLQQGLARRRGLDPAAPALQQRGAHRGLQRAQPLADGRAHDGLALGGAGDVAGFADGDKQAQRGQVQVVHRVMVFRFGNIRLPKLHL